MILDRRDLYPFLDTNPELLYFDSASTTPIHSAVLNAMNKYYSSHCTNVNRNGHWLESTTHDAVTQARESVAKLINADSDRVLFTSGATESLNWVAQWHCGVPQVIITAAEHSSNIAPWLAQGRSEQTDTLKVIPVKDNGMLDEDAAQKILSRCPQGSLLCITAISNASGLSMPWKRLTDLARFYGLSTCVDFSQSMMITAIDLRNTPLEFAVFSAHKMFGPKGIGALYASKQPLQPIKYGGGMLASIDFDTMSVVDDVSRYQAGTPNIPAIIGFGCAADLLQYETGFDLQSHVLDALDWLIDAGLYDIDGLTPIESDCWGHIRSFVPRGCHSNDIGELLSQSNIMLRTGNLCAEPYVNKLSKGAGIVRISVGPYNTLRECEQLVSQLRHTLKQLV